MSYVIFFINFGTSRSHTYVGFGRFFSYNLSIGYKKLIPKSSIWAIVKLPGINKSRDTAVWIFWTFLGYEKNFIFLHFWCWKWQPTPNLLILLDLSSIFSISLEGCEFFFFFEKSRRNGEKSKFLENFFWTISTCVQNFSF